MTVQELQRKLDDCDMDAEVYIEPVFATSPCDNVDYDEEQSIVYLN